MSNNSLTETKVFITQSAYDDILRECLRWEEVETGTVLVGAQIPNSFVVTKTFLPGPQAGRTSGSFSPDIAYVQKILEAYRAHHPGEDFLGVHHQHPAWLNRPSGGDRQQAMAMLRDPAYRINGRLLSLISIREHEGIRIFPYRITLSDPLFRPLLYEVLPDGDPRIVALLTHSLFRRSYVPPEAGTSFWDDPEFQWYRTPRGARRLEEEVRIIRERIGIQPRLTKTGDGTFVIRLRRLILVYPPEYPLNPPRLFGQQKEGTLKEIRIAPWGHWDSGSSVSEILMNRHCKRYVHSPPIQRMIFKSVNAANQSLARSLIALGQRLQNINLFQEEGEP